MINEFVSCVYDMGDRSLLGDGSRVGYRHVVARHGLFSFAVKENYFNFFSTNHISRLDWSTTSMWTFSSEQILL